MATIDVHYARKFGWPGRRYAKGPAAQRLTREARAIAFGRTSSAEGLCDPDIVVDVDMINSFPACIRQHILRVNPTMWPSLTNLKNYVEHPEQWRCLLIGYFDVTRREAKQMLLRIFLAESPAEISLCSGLFARMYNRAWTLSWKIPASIICEANFPSVRPPGRAVFSMLCPL